MKEEASVHRPRLLPLSLSISIKIYFIISRKTVNISIAAASLLICSRWRVCCLSISVMTFVSVPNPAPATFKLLAAIRSRFCVPACRVRVPRAGKSPSRSRRAAVPDVCVRRGSLKYPQCAPAPGSDRRRIS